MINLFKKNEESSFSPKTSTLIYKIAKEINPLLKDFNHFFESLNLKNSMKFYIDSICLYSISIDPFTSAIQVNHLQNNKIIKTQIYKNDNTGKTAILITLCVTYLKKKKYILKKYNKIISGKWKIELNF